MRFRTDFPLQMPSAAQALPGRSQALVVTNVHHVHRRTIQPPFPPNCREALFGLGCFWGAEQVFWQLDGVYTTAVGYSGGMTPNPTYEEVCSGLTGHSEVVQVIYEPTHIDYLALLCVFWEAHDPTQGMRQGNDIGTQYRSSIYTLDSDQAQLATESKQHYGKPWLQPDALPLLLRSQRQRHFTTPRITTSSIFRKIRLGTVASVVPGFGSAELQILRRIRRAIPRPAVSSASGRGQRCCFANHRRIEF